MKCGISDSEDFDVLVGTEMVFAVGMTICTWPERVEFRTRYWKKEGPLGQLPVMLVKVEPKRAYQATAGQTPGEQQARGQKGPKGAEEEPKMKLMDEPRHQTDWRQPIRLVELFGGIGAGLAAVVRSGIAVRQWIYVEQAPAARKMAEHHALKLHVEFPELLNREVIREAMGRTIHDVRKVTETEVASWGQ
ncbi:unnamed protein product, partial [Closterium sp. NIES-53]